MCICVCVCVNVYVCVLWGVGGWRISSVCISVSEQLGTVGGDHKLDKEITAKCANKLKCACFCKHCLTT